MVLPPYKAHTEQSTIKIVIHVQQRPYLLSISNNLEVIEGKLLVNGLVVEYGHAE